MNIHLRKFSNTIIILRACEYARGELRTSTNSVVLMIRKRNDELSDNNFKP